MKVINLTLAFVALFLSFCTCHFGEFGFTGAIFPGYENVGYFLGSNCNVNNPISTGNYFYPYVAFNVNINQTTEAYYFVWGASSRLGYAFELQFSIYNTTFNQSNTCEGMYQTLSLYDGNFDVVNFLESNYTLVISSSSTWLIHPEIWALNFFPSTVILDINESDENKTSYAPYYNFGSPLNCEIIVEYQTAKKVYYDTFTWLQETTGYFDVYVKVVDHVFQGITFSPLIALYSGDVSNFSIYENSPCVSSFITSIGGHTPNQVSATKIFLSNQTYTIVGFIIGDIDGSAVYHQGVGKLAVLISVSNVQSLSSSSTFYPPNLNSIIASNFLDFQTCTVDTTNNTPQFYQKTFTLENSIYIFLIPNSQVIAYVYQGNEFYTNGSCSNLVNFMYNPYEEVYSVGVNGTIGENYTLVVATNPFLEERSLYISTEIDFSLRILTGVFVNDADFVVSPTESFVVNNTIPSYIPNPYLSLTSSSLTSSPPNPIHTGDPVTASGTFSDSADPSTISGSSSSSGTGSVFGDPHFVGLSGEKYDIQGEPDFWFNILTDFDCQVNAFFSLICNKERATAIGKLGMLINGRELYFNLTHVIVENNTMSVGESIGLGFKSQITRDKKYVQIVTTSYKINVITYFVFNTIPFNSDCSSGHFDIKVSLLDDNRRPHGLLGQTAHHSHPNLEWFNVMKKHFENGDGEIEGNWEHYKVENEFGRDFRFNKYFYEFHH